jgi:hypothetical protein
MGANKRLSLVFRGTAGGGYFELDGSVNHDPMKVESFAATILHEVGCAPVLGVQIYLGKLTGAIVDGVEWLKVGIVGNGGDTFVRADYPFTSEYGLCVYIHPTLTADDYVIKGAASHG